MKIFSFFMSPANYTLDVIASVYTPMGIDYAFIQGESEASDQTCSMVALSKMSVFKRFLFISRTLRQYDVFLVNSYVDRVSLLVLVLNILFFRKPIGICSDTQLNIPKGMLKRALKRFFLGWLFGRTCVYGLPGGTVVHRELFRYYKMPEHRIMFLPMMVDNARYSRSDVVPPGRTFRFVFVGRLIPCKQVEKIVEAFQSLESPARDIEFHVVGDGEERLALQNLSRTSRVVFHGRQYGAGLINILHSMHCLILFSSYEAWGLVVNEALASGVPCIVSDKVGARYDLVEGDNPAGVVVDSNNVMDLSRAMLEFLSPEKWEMYSLNARARMKSWDFELYRSGLVKFVEKASAKGFRK